jgi:hypothetical protein
MCLFRHGQRGVGRRTRRRASFEEDIEVEVESGSEIQTEGVMLDEEVRYRRNIGALKEQMTQMEQGNAQGCPAALFTEITRGIDTWLWFVQTSRQAGS